MPKRQKRGSLVQRTSSTLFELRCGEGLPVLRTSNREDALSCKNLQDLTTKRKDRPLERGRSGCGGPALSNARPAGADGSGSDLDAGHAGGADLLGGGGDEDLVLVVVHRDGLALDDLLACRNQHAVAERADGGAVDLLAIGRAMAGRRRQLVGFARADEGLDPGAVGGDRDEGDQVLATIAAIALRHRMMLL